MSKRLYLDIHVIQTVPPSCLNRDDTGSPKTAIYGGVQRARVSSQSWKRAMREMFKENLDEACLGVRTKKIVELIVERVKQRSEVPVEGVEGKVIDTINLASAKAEKPIIPTSAKKAKKRNNDKDSDNDNTKDVDALFFIGNVEADNLADLVLAWIMDDRKPTKNDVQSALNQDKNNQSHAIEIALFGRMVAKAPDLNTDASSQVAHALSTHRVDIEYDYFTAVDDLASEDNRGAAMIDTVEFDSATFYRYATIAVHELFGQLAHDVDVTALAASEFVKAFITSMPTGKQNAFANRTPADAVLVSLRTDQPLNLVGAFEEAVRLKPDESGYVKPSIDRLVKYYQKVVPVLIDAPQQSWGIGVDLSGVAELPDLSTLLLSINSALSSDLGSTIVDGN